MLARTDRRMRLVALIAIFCLIAVALTGRLAYWQVGQRERLVALAQSQLERTVIQPSQRGTVYDRSGTVVLATTVSRDLLWATPAEISEDRRGPVADELVRILGVEGAAADQVREALLSGRPYAVIARELSASQSQQVGAGLDDGSLTGVGLDPTPIRSFPTAGGAPNTSLASQLIGFVDSQGNGRYGIEQRWQALLAGTPRRSIAQFDATGRPISATQQVVDPGVPGADVQLTIDASLQLKFEQELLAARTAHDAAFASAVAMDPYTGEILAWATAPGYDANSYSEVADTEPERFGDPIHSQVYEPGSVFKMFTTLAGLERGSFTLKTKLNDTGTLVVGGGQIWDSDRKPMGVMSVADIVAFSRNVGAAKMAMRLGPDTSSAAQALYETWRAMGFGQRSGVDVAGEVSGLVRDPTLQPWREIDLVNGSFGQGVAVTQLQLVQAYAAMVNGGILVPPHVVGVAAGDPIEGEPGHRVMSPELSTALTGLMRHVVTAVPWYARGTLIEGFDVGGKTGTAQIWDSAAGEYKPHRFNLSFVGFVGRDQPRIVIAVRIADAVGTAVSIPVNSHEVFRRLAQDAMDTLDLPPPAQIALDDEVTGFAGTTGFAGSAGSDGTGGTITP
jgi:cell division protein FtsI/penicillin-binding protein 2